VITEPVLTGRTEGGAYMPVLVWRFAEPLLAISSAVLGGGIATCGWVVNATVPIAYDRSDPDRHLGEIAAYLDLHGPGVGLLTGVDVADVVAAEEDGVRLWVTVGLGDPIQAAAPIQAAPTRAALSGAGPSEVAPSAAGPSAAGPSAAGPSAAGPSAAGPAATGPAATGPAATGPSEVASTAASPSAARAGAQHAGTVNVVAWVPVRLGAGALVNAVTTLTEAKTQAIRDLGLAATGTATDAVCMLCPVDGPAAEYGGPCSTWGEWLARAAYRAVLDGGRVNLAGPRSWSERQGRR
jgi:adenosylcobinamide hydrolase